MQSALEPASIQLIISCMQVMSKVLDASWSVSGNGRAEGLMV